MDKSKGCIGILMIVVLAITIGFVIYCYHGVQVIRLTQQQLSDATIPTNRMALHFPHGYVIALSQNWAKLHSVNSSSHLLMVDRHTMPSSSDKPVLLFVAGSAHYSLYSVVGDGEKPVQFLLQGTGSTQPMVGMEYQIEDCHHHFYSGKTNEQGNTGFMLAEKACPLRLYVVDGE